MILREVDIFRGIEPGVMEEIVNMCSEENYPKGTVLFERGTVAENLYFLEEGAVDLVIRNGGYLVFGLKEPGEVFGWSSMFEPGRNTATSVCATDVKLVRIEREKLEKLFERHPDTGITILKRMGSVCTRRLTNAYRDLLLVRAKDVTPTYG